MQVVAIAVPIPSLNVAQVSFTTEETEGREVTEFRLFALHSFHADGVYQF